MKSFCKTVSCWFKPGLLFAFIPFFCLLITACGDEKLPPGVVATVNGEPITLHSVQALLDSRSTALDLQASTSFEEMRCNYGKALGILIATALARQELAARGLAPTENDLDQAIERISSDFGDESLDKFLEEVSLRPEEWRQLMRDHLALEIFRNQILLPAIKIEFQEVRDYYQEHKDEFKLPETIRACFLAAEKRQEIVEWCASVAQRNFEGDAIAQCVEARPEEIPQPWNKELKVLKPLTCGKIYEEEGEWQTVALLERQPARVPELSEVYALVERILLEPKQAAAFERWLDAKLQTAQVMIAPELSRCFLEHGAHQHGFISSGG